MTPYRPVLRWHGGKWRQAARILANLPAHRCYVEPYGGAASVLLRKPRSHAEIYNDLDGDLVALFRLLRDRAQAARLVADLELTPFAREEFEAAYGATPEDPVERSRRLIVRSFMGFGSDASTGVYRTGFRANSTRGGTVPAREWSTYPAALAQIVERMRGVIVEQRPAIRVMSDHDGPETVHYVDPPYPHAVRGSNNRRGGVGCHVYAHEMDDAAHAELLSALDGLTGMVVLSSYANPLYDATLRHWHCVDYAALADGARKRVETLYLNPAAAARLDAPQLELAAA